MLAAETRAALIGASRAARLHAGVADDVAESAIQVLAACAASIMIYLADKFGSEELLPKVWLVCRGGLSCIPAVLAIPASRRRGKRRRVAVYSAMCNLRQCALQDLKSRTQVISWVMFQMVGSSAS